MAAGIKGAAAGQQDRLIRDFLLKQSFEAQDVSHRGALHHPPSESGEIWPLVEADELLCPASHNEQISIGQGKVLTEQKRSGAEPFVDKVELLTQIADDELLHLIGSI